MTPSPYPLNWNRDKQAWDTVSFTPEAADKPEDAKAKVEGRRYISQVLARFFGSPDHPKHPSAGEITVPPFNSGGGDSEGDAPQEPLEKGRTLYVKYCMHCHGYYGWGDGPTSDFLLPKPRDFRRGVIKFTSTKGDSKPTHNDLKRTIAQGVPGTMMPAFGPIVPGDDLVAMGIAAGFAGPPDFDVEAVASYIEVLLARGELERKLCLVFADDPSNLTPETIKAQLQGILDGWKAAPDNVITPDASKRPARTPEAIAASVEAGKTAFLQKEAQCVSCHGPLGLGDALDPNQKNDWGLPALPANLTFGVYRGGRRPVDLYRRIAAGIKGTPMPGRDDLPPEKIWNLVDFVQSIGLRTPE
jgi:mono/diheme cytochrome c family protein